MTNMPSQIMPRKARLAFAAVLGCALAGCAATPAINLAPQTPAFAGQAAIPFRLTDGLIALGVPAANGGGDTPTPPVSFARIKVRCPADGSGFCSMPVIPWLAPVDFTAATYAITPRKQKFIETRLAPTYATNSLRLAELAIEVKDHRIELIQAIGKAAVGLARLQSGSTSAPDVTIPMRELQLPLVIEAAAARAPDSDGARCRQASPVAGAGGCHALPGNPGWSYRLVATDDPVAQGFIPRARLSEVRDRMVASICRPAVLALDFTDAEGVHPILTLRLTTVDPDFLSTMPLPSKGQLVFHPVCGMDLKRQQVTETGVDAITAAIFDQIAAVHAAVK